MRRHHRRHRRLRRAGERSFRRVVRALVCIALCVTAALLLLRRVDDGSVVYDEQTLRHEAEALSEVVDVGGIPCVPRKNVRSFLFLGIDDSAVHEENYEVGGMSDMLMLLVVDYTHGTCRKLPINRNTICQVRSYNDKWEDLGLSEVQIAVAHANGDGGERSCENTVEAVSTYLYGADIENYLALDIESIPVVNHMVGGVTVPIEDDFSRADPSLVMGQTVTLSDEQAISYVRGRMSVGDGTNESRMRRQDRYFDAMLARLVEQSTEDVGYALDFYDGMTPYMVTDMNGKAFSRLIRGLIDCEDLGQVVIDGTIGVDMYGFATFEPDPDSVRDAVIELFYTPVEDADA